MRMTSSFVSLLIVLPLVGMTVGFAQIPADLQQAISERQKAVDGADADAWSRLTSDDFTQVDANGIMRNKAERLAQMKQQTPQPSPTPRQQPQINVYGNAAVERERVGNLWVIQVWVRQPQGWQVVATQLTTAAK